MLGLIRARSRLILLGVDLQSVMFFFRQGFWRFLGGLLEGEFLLLGCQSWGDSFVVLGGALEQVWKAFFFSHCIIALCTLEFYHCLVGSTLTKPSLSSYPL
jgi:hypothetical protein